MAKWLDCFEGYCLTVSILRVLYPSRHWLQQNGEAKRQARVGAKHLPDALPLGGSSAYELTGVTVPVSPAFCHTGVGLGH